VDLGAVRSAIQLDRLLKRLSIEECDRVARIHATRDRLQFVARRVALRSILARYVGVDPDALELRPDSNGKPLLLAPHGRPALQFNLSHTPGLALIAVTEALPVGVDIERVRPVPEADQIAARFFTAREQAVLMQLSAARRHAAFIRIWTHKEAVLKAEGVGLAGSLDRVEVSHQPVTHACIVNEAGAEADQERWFVKELRPRPGYIGAVATRSRGLRLTCFQTDPLPAPHALSIPR
jgi:4'-phosphopantetheinyl transferase